MWRDVRWLEKGLKRLYITTLYYTSLQPVFTCSPGGNMEVYLLTHSYEAKRWPLIKMI